MAKCLYLGVITLLLWTQLCDRSFSQVNVLSPDKSGKCAWWCLEMMFRNLEMNEIRGKPLKERNGGRKVGSTSRQDCLEWLDRNGVDYQVGKGLRSQRWSMLEKATENNHWAMIGVVWDVPYATYHAILVTKVGKEIVTILNPSKGYEEEMDRKELDRAWTGFIVVVYRNGEQYKKLRYDFESD